MDNDLKKIIGNEERIIWEGKPDKKCFYFESIFNPMMPFALLWFLFDFAFIGGIAFATSKEGAGIALFLIPFFAFHLMPVWIYLGGVLMASKKYKNMYYIITDKAIYVSGGVFSKHIDTKPFAEMSHINLHRGIFDQKFGVGDIVCTSNSIGYNGASTSITISSISNYDEVYNIVKKLQQDIYSDIMYPNAKRPEENTGYNTKYKGL